MRWPASRRPCGSQTFAKISLAPWLTASRVRPACNACCRSMQTDFPACCNSASPLFVGIQSLTMPSLPQTDKDALESLIDPGPRTPSARASARLTASSVTIIMFRLLLLLLLCACALASTVEGQPALSEQQHALAPSPHSLDAIARAAAESFLEQHQAATTQDAQLDSASLGVDPVKRDASAFLDLDPAPLQLLDQHQLGPAQYMLPKVLQVTASGLTGIAEAGKNLFDGIAQVLQQSQVAWANLQNATNLTRILQDSLSDQFGDQISQAGWQLTLNDTMPPSSSSRQNNAAQANSTFWLELVDHNGSATYNPTPDTYKVFRNVRDFGAKGDGVTDDTDAINQAISQGNRCGQGCGSSTISPALVYFPPGIYLVSSPIVSYYYTQLVGSATDRPTLLAAPSFQGIAVIDEDPYGPDGSNWYINQNNFFRAVYNFKIDLTNMPASSGTGIHHQVSQATSLFNVHVEMRQDPDGNAQQGIFIENGSGGFMADLSFRGGRYGAYLGNQQFTVRNATFENCQTAISQAWNWGWSYHDIRISNCTLGYEMRTSPNPASGNQGAASVLAYDWTLSNVDTAFNITTPDSGTVVLDNIAIENVRAAVSAGGANAQAVLLDGSQERSVIKSWVQGAVVQGQQQLDQAQTISDIDIQRPSSLVDASKLSQPYFSRSRPQYQGAAASDFVNVKELGCAGDGTTDDSKALQQILDSSAGNKIVYVPHGTYYLESTVTLPPGTRMVGEVWPVLMGGGPLFQNGSDPQPVIRVGSPGDSGVIEISDMVFSTRGPAAGAIVVEWNIRELDGQQGSAAVWDSHIRVGGFAGTNLEADKCAREQPLSEQCRASFINLHLTANSSAYIENMWVWTADHDLDYGERAQVNLLSGRGILVESKQGPVWMYGGASEHSVLYQYNIVGASNIFISLAQTETAYFQGAGRAVASAEEPLSLQRYQDPNFNLSSAQSPTSPFANTSDPYENRGLGMRIANSTNTLVYGAGLYSFFDNYNQAQASNRRSQKRILWLENVDSQANVWVLNLNTVGVEKMVTVDAIDTVDEGPLRNGFGNTLAVWAAQIAW